MTLACDLEDINKPYVNSEGLHPRIIVAKYEPNRPIGFRGEDFYVTDLGQSVTFSVWSVRMFVFCLCVCPSHFSKPYSSYIAWRILFILGHNDPWVKAFRSYIRFGHIFKVKVTVQGQSSLYKHIGKLQNPTPLKPLSGFCSY